PLSLHDALPIYPGVRAVARYFQGEVGELSPAVPAILLGIRRGVRRSRLAGLEARGRQLRAGRAHPYRLVFPPFPHHSAAAPLDRKAEAASRLDQRSDRAQGARGGG